MNDRDRFHRFTERARRVLYLAQEEAQRFQHNYIGTEHLLLGLIREKESVGATVLEKLGIELQQVRNEIETIIGRGDRIILGETGLTPRSRKVIELAVDEARHLNHHYIGTEHILLGLVREGEGIAATVLELLGANLEKIRMETIQVLSQRGPSQTQPEAGSSQRGIDTTYNITEIPPLKMPYDKFTERARKVLSLSQEEALRFQHNYIGTEHLLLGLVREGEGIAARVLQDLGVELKRVRDAVEFIIGHGDRIVLGEIGLTPRAKKVIQLAVDEARLMQHQYIGTEHILLGLVREGEGIAAGVLASQGVELETVRTQILKVLQSGTAGPVTPNEPVQDENAPASYPPLPPEAARLLAENEPALTCAKCQSVCPAYFQFCFRCGTRLASE